MKKVQSSFAVQLMLSYQGQRINFGVSRVIEIGTLLPCGRSHCFQALVSSQTFNPIWVECVHRLWGRRGEGEVRSEHVSHLLSSARSIKVFLESTKPQSSQPAASPQLVVVLVVVVLAPHEHRDYVI